MTLYIKVRCRIKYTTTKFTYNVECHIRYRMSRRGKTDSEKVTQGFKIRRSHAFARLLTATLDLGANVLFFGWHQQRFVCGIEPNFNLAISKVRGFKTHLFWPHCLFLNTLNLFLQIDSMNSRKEHSLHLLYTGHLVIRTSKAWRYNQIVLNQTN